MRLRNLIGVAVFSLIGLWANVSPAHADDYWVSLPYTVDVVNQGGTPGATAFWDGDDGYTGVTLSSLADLAFVSYQESGGATLTVSRAFEKLGNPGNKLVFLTMAIGGGAGVTVDETGEGYAFSRATANGTSSFPDSRVLDRYVQASQPFGLPWDNFSDDDVSDDIGDRTRDLSVSTVLQGTIYSFSETGSNQFYVTQQGAYSDVFIALD